MRASALGGVRVRAIVLAPCLVWLALLVSGPVQAAPEITILSTMVANFNGTGEWGFSALIETDDETILFDTGFKADTVRTNAEALGKDLSEVERVVLTHFHSDHTGGLLSLRRVFREQNPAAFSTVYVARGFFRQRYLADGSRAWSLGGQQFTENFATPMGFRTAAEKLGIRFIEVTEPLKIAPGMQLTGPVPRVYPERNVNPGFFLHEGDPSGTLTPDTVPESQALGIQTDQGWILLSGCGHAGMINAAHQLKAMKDQAVYMGIGGFHLFRADAETIEWTATHLQEFGMERLVGAHCTGVEATWRLAELLEIQRSHVSIGAIGTRIDEQLNIHRASIE